MTELARTNDVCEVTWYVDADPVTCFSLSSESEPGTSSLPCRLIIQAHVCSAMVLAAVLCEANQVARAFENNRVFESEYTLWRMHLQEHLPLWTYGFGIN